MRREAAHRLLRLVGWLLTPVVVWAASFLGGWIGATVQGPNGGLSWLVIGAVVGGMVGGGVWVGVMWWVGKREDGVKGGAGSAQ